MIMILLSLILNHLVDGANQLLSNTLETRLCVVKNAYNESDFIYYH